MFLQYLSDDKHHINHSATAEYDDDYRLPFLCLYTPNGAVLRTLVDSGASLSLIDHRTADRIQLELLGSTVLTVSGFGSTVTTPSNVYKLLIQTTNKQAVSFRVAGSPQLPPTKFQIPTLSKDDVKFLKKKNIKFEDQTVEEFITNQNIDMIMGNDIISWIQSQPSTKRIVLPSGRLLEMTPFGVLLYPTPNFGLIIKTHIIDDVALKPSDSQNIVMALLDTSDPEDPLTKLIGQVAQMWKLETIGISAPEMVQVSLQETRDLLEEFKANVKYNKEGIFEVALPLNGNETRLADNYEIAIKRLGSLTVTLKKGNNLLKTYDDIIKEQLSRGIIDVVTGDMIQNAKHKEYLVYYIPHRAVIKHSLATTKVRIIYDASSHKRDEFSLNDCVSSGPCILQSIFGTLLRARMYKYIAAGVIEKAFEQVQMKEEYRDMTRFLWLKDIAKPVTPDNIQILHFKKIPTGLACSPFLLNATILHFLKLNPNDLNEMTEENICVDNVMYYTNHKSDIPKIVKGSKKTFNDMSMNLREFIVNDSEEMRGISEKDRAADTTVEMLGYSWNTITDTWTIKLVTLEEKHPTKRQVASRLAESIDPTGITGPIIVPLKRLMQLCWTDNLEWNQPLPQKLLIIYRKIQEGIQDPTITIPRQVTTNYSNSKLRLMVFSDASQDMMAACVYTHYSYESGPPVINLLCSKNMIKPANNENMTIPKMELTAIIIGTNLAITAMKEIRIPVVEICFLTDSSISFFWILKEHSTRPYVSNRVNDYHTNKSWIEKKGTEVALLHCPTEFNPSDVATRGLTTPEYNENQQWPHGPKFLLDGRETWPNKIEGSITNVKEFHDLVFQEIVDPVTQKRKRSRIPKPDPPKAETIMLVTPDEKFTSIVPFYRTNSMRKLVTIVHKTLLAVCKAFPNHQWDSFVMKQFTKESEDQPTLRRKMARTFVIQQHYIEADEQGLSFPSDIHTFKDQDGLIRYRKEVKSCVLPAEAHTPIMIHNKHKIAFMIVRELHEINGHLPAGYLLSALQTRYYICHATAIINKVISECTKCKKVTGKPYAYPNCQVLPSLRTEPSIPFEKAGLDYLGPLQYIKEDGSIGNCYVLVYTCLVTRGARLELVPDGTTERYMEALRIVFSRSGTPKVIYSDNASTFRLGEKLINEDIRSHEPSESLTSFLADREIDFIYITPLSPWQGGVYERIVGLVKHQLQKELGKTLLDFHSLRCILAGVETMINIRPLTPHMRNTDDMVALRPIDFQLPGVLLELPANEIPFDPKRSKTDNRTREHLQKLDAAEENLWKGWALGYLLHLRESKHKNKRCSTLKPKVGQVVMINTNLVRRQKWPLGIITKVFESKDGIKTAVVKCKGRLYKRSVCHLIPLEIESVESQDRSPEDVNTDDDPGYKSIPDPPQPAIFDIPKAEYAPKRSIDSKKDLVPSAGNLPTIGEHDPEEEIDYDTQHLDTEPADGEYRDPNMTTKQILDYGKHAVPDTRTREYLPRKAKAPYINYVHAAVVSSSGARPPQCCQFSPMSWDTDNLKTL
ncbi:unnamed protein product [Caenorhabditis nigoni]